MDIVNWTMYCRKQNLLPDELYYRHNITNDPGWAIGQLVEELMYIRKRQRSLHQQFCF